MLEGIGNPCRMIRSPLAYEKDVGKSVGEATRVERLP